MLADGTTNPWGVQLTTGRTFPLCSFLSPHRDSHGRLAPSYRKAPLRPTLEPPPTQMSACGRIEVLLPARTAGGRAMHGAWVRSPR